MPLKRLHAYTKKLVVWIPQSYCSTKIDVLPLLFSLRPNQGTKEAICEVVEDVQVHGVKNMPTFPRENRRFAAGEKMKSCSQN